MFSTQPCTSLENMCACNILKVILLLLLCNKKEMWTSVKSHQRFTFLLNSPRPTCIFMGAPSNLPSANWAPVPPGASTLSQQSVHATGFYYWVPSHLERQARSKNRPTVVYFFFFTTSELTYNWPKQGWLQMWIQIHMIKFKFWILKSSSTQWGNPATDPLYRNCNTKTDSACTIHVYQSWKCPTYNTE